MALNIVNDFQSDPLRGAVDLYQRGRLEEAERICREAMGRQPAPFAAAQLLGFICVRTGRAGEAIGFFERAIGIHASESTSFVGLGSALQRVGRLDEAMVAFQRALALNANSVEALNNLGILLEGAGKLDEAIEMYERALRVKPGLASARGNLGYALLARGDARAAIAALREAVALQPGSARMRSMLIFAMQFDPETTGEAQRAAQVEWGHMHAAPLEKMIKRFDNDRSPERRLRVGYVCPEFRDHALGRYILPLLREHDAGGFEIFCYSNTPAADEFTERFRKLAAGWREIAELGDEAAAELVRRDGIDILVDLTLHMNHDRLLLFARKPAPVQVTFGGYPGSTGVAAIDYRLSDPYLEPDGRDWDLGPEKVVRLPHTFWCYDPLTEEPGVNALPAAAAGHVTFGCLNNPIKINGEVLKVWARVLREVADSHILMHAAEGKHRAEMRAWFEKEGIGGERIEFASKSGRGAYLERFHRVDISLDPFPYNGHTSSLDSMWMGVPVVTLAGKTIVGRAGESQLMNIGMPEFMAREPGEYVSKAVALARDVGRLAELRRTLRERMRASPLMDAAGFARGVEGAYRDMWRRWCDS